MEMNRYFGDNLDMLKWYLWRYTEAALQGLGFLLASAAAFFGAQDVIWLFFHSGNFRGNRFEGIYLIIGIVAALYFAFLVNKAYGKKAQNTELTLV